MMVQHAETIRRFSWGGGRDCRQLATFALPTIVLNDSEFVVTRTCIVVEDLASHLNGSLSAGRKVVISVAVLHVLVECALVVQTRLIPVAQLARPTVHCRRIVFIGRESTIRLESQVA